MLLATWHGRRLCPHTHNFKKRIKNHTSWVPHRSDWCVLFIVLRHLADILIEVRCYSVVWYGDVADQTNSRTRYRAPSNFLSPASDSSQWLFHCTPYIYMPRCTLSLLLLLPCSRCADNHRTSLALWPTIACWRPRVRRFPFILLLPANYTVDYA